MIQAWDWFFAHMEKMDGLFLAVLIGFVMACLWVAQEVWMGGEEDDVD